MPEDEGFTIIDQPNNERVSLTLFQRSCSSCGRLFMTYSIDTLTCESCRDGRGLLFVPPLSSA
jgi:hypothetical protein